MDDELEEDERITKSRGGNSPDYTPNESIRVSDEDQRVFFNKKQKASKIKTEARKAQDKQYINQVRQLKEKAAALRKVSINTANVEPRTSAAHLTHPTSHSRERRRSSSEMGNIGNAYTGRNTCFSQIHSASRPSTTTAGKGGCNISIASGNTNNSIANSYPSSSLASQTHNHQQISSSNSVNFFDQLDRPIELPKRSH